MKGYDSENGHLATVSGNTFVIQEAEQDIAEGWQTAIGAKQPQLSITCKTDDECVIENMSKHGVVHGRKIGPR